MIWNERINFSFYFLWMKNHLVIFQIIEHQKLHGYCCTKYSTRLFSMKSVTAICIQHFLKSISYTWVTRFFCKNAERITSQVLSPSTNKAKNDNLVLKWYGKLFLKEEITWIWRSYYSGYKTKLTSLDSMKCIHKLQFLFGLSYQQFTNVLLFLLHHHPCHILKIPFSIKSSISSEIFHWCLVNSPMKSPSPPPLKSPSPTLTTIIHQQKLFWTRK